MCNCILHYNIRFSILYYWCIVFWCGVWVHCVYHFTLCFVFVTRCFFLYENGFFLFVCGWCV